MHKIIIILLAFLYPAIAFSQPVFRSAAQVRQRATADTSSIHELSFNHITAQYKYDPSDRSSPDDSATVIVNAAGQRFKAVFNTQQINVKLFGAIGDGVADDWPAIQKAINTIVNHPNLPRTLFFPQGVYSISKPLIVAVWNGTNYTFCSINLVGQQSAHFNSTAQEAVIAPTFTNTFALGFQMARSGIVQGLVIRGLFSPASGMANWRAYYNRPYSSWVTSQDSRVRDSQYSPYAGIVIDPFRNTNTRPPDGGYPNLGSWYRGDGSATNSGSSAISIEDCRISGFTVDILLSPNGQTSNAEDIQVRRCALEVAKAAYAVCQFQSKDNFIRDAISWDRVHTLIDNGTYGNQKGQPPYVDGWNIAGDIIELANLPNVEFTTSFSNIFAESIFRIGTLNGKVAVMNSEFNFNIIPNPLLIPHSHLEGKGSTFFNCGLRYFDNYFNKRLIFYAVSTFYHCSFDDLPIEPTSYSKESTEGLSFHDCFVGQDKVIGWENFKGQYSSTNPKIIAYGHVRSEDGGVIVANSFINNLGMTFDAGSAERSYLLTSPIKVTIDSVSRTGTTTLAGNDRFFIAAGDYLTSYTNGFRVLGKVSGINRTSGALTLVDCPLGSNSGTYHAFAIYYDIIGGMFVGDVTKGSDKITNVEKSTLLCEPFVGQRLKVGQTYARPIIDAVSANTITMSIPADYSQHAATNPFLSKDFGGAERMQIQAFDNPVHLHSPSFLEKLNVLFPVGAIWVAPVSQLQTAEADKRFICVRPGYISPSTIGKTLQAEWKPIDETGSAGTAAPGWQTIKDGTAGIVAPGVVNVLVNPPALLTAYTLTMPAGPTDGAIIKIHFGGTIGGGSPVVSRFITAASTGQNIIQSSPSKTAVGGNCFIYQYNASTGAWYQEQ